MSHLGHGLALEHPIYRTPIAASFTWEERACRKGWVGHVSPRYPKGPPETIRYARFEKKEPEVANPTLVSHEGFFTDVPGFENLCEADTSKTLGSLSLARQGRYFYWGYSLDPAELTEGGRAVLVNVLHYMKGTRDAVMIPYVCETRRSLWIYTFLGRESGYRRGVEEHFPNCLVPDWRDSLTRTFEGAKTWVDTYLPYVYSGKTAAHRSERYDTIFEVDADAMALKTPNAKRTSLERWVALTQEKPSEDRRRALRCLDRYVHADVRPPGTAEKIDWRAWYDREGKRICFIESTGFWWQLDPLVQEREARKERVRRTQEEAK